MSGVKVPRDGGIKGWYLGIEGVVPRDGPERVRNSYQYTGHCCYWINLEGRVEYLQWRRGSARDGKEVCGRGE